MKAGLTIWQDLKTLATRYHHGQWQLSLDQRKQIVAEAIENLPEQSRMLLALRYYEGLGISELAETLGSTQPDISRAIGNAVGTVYSSLIQAERRHGGGGA